LPRRQGPDRDGLIAAGGGDAVVLGGHGDSENLTGVSPPVELPPGERIPEGDEPRLVPVAAAGDEPAVGGEGERPDVARQARCNRMLGPVRGGPSLDRPVPQ